MALSDTLAAYYRLDDVTDSSGNGFTLTNNGSTVFAPAKIGNGADFGTPNTTKYLSVVNNLGVTNGVCTISLWTKIATEPATNDNYFLVHLGDAGTNVEYVICYTNNAGTKQLYVNRVKQNVSNNEVRSNQTLGTTSWHHIVVTFDGSTLQLWLDGSSLGTFATSGNGASAGITGLRIGTDLNTAAWMVEGMIDEVGIWRRVLTAAEIALLYNGGYGQSYKFGEDITTGLVSYWKLDDASGNAVDSVGTATLTNNGTTTFTSALINNGADYGTANATKYFRSGTTNLGIDGGAITISTWIKMQTEIGSAKQAIALQGSVTSQVNYIIYYDYNAGTRRLTFNRQKQALTNNETSGNATLGTTQWHHIVLTYDGTNLAGWLDGVQIAPNLATSGNGGSAAVSQFMLGFEDQQTGGYLSAFQDETGVWNRVLSLNEILTLYRNRAGNTIPFISPTNSFQNLNSPHSSGLSVTSSTM